MIDPVSDVSRTLPQIQYMFPCENVTQDMAGNVSFSGVFDNLTAPSFPTITPVFYIVFGLHHVLPGIYSARLLLEHEDGQAVLDQQLEEVVGTSKQEKSRIVIGFKIYAWQRPGRYHAKLVISGTVIGAFAIDVKQGT